MSAGVLVRPATAEDAGSIAEIYNHFIEHTVVTFEEEKTDAAEMRRRIERVWSATLPWLVAVEERRVVGYAYAARWNERAAYRHSAEITVYLSPKETGRGVGTLLYGELFRILRAAGKHTVIGGIALPNPASVGLHEKLGLRKVAHFEAVGFKFGRWIDVGYWQGML